MDKRKKANLKAVGWRTGSAADFLELTPEEAAYVEVKVNLSAALRERRHDQGMSQVELAKRLGSSQSRVAKMEASDPSVTVDLLIRALLATGASNRQIAGAIGQAKPRGTRKAAARGNFT